MLRVFEPINGGKLGLREISLKQLHAGCWIDCREPSDEEIKQLAKLTRIPEEDLRAPLDPEERSRVDQTRRYTMIIYRVPFIETLQTEEGEEEREISTAPIGIFLTRNFVVTVRLYRSLPFRYIRERGLAGKLRVRSASELVVALLTEISRDYSKLLRRIEKEIDAIEDDIIREPTRVTVERIMDTKKTLIYFHRSLIANRLVLLLALEKGIRFIDRKLREQFVDLHTDTMQLIEMSGTYRDVLAGALDAYTSIASTSLNTRINLLTTIMTILTVLAILALLYAANIQLPAATFMTMIGVLIFSVWISWLIFKWRKWI
jgi:magnesium transporter